jgi:hypothetical protein
MSSYRGALDPRLRRDLLEAQKPSFLDPNIKQKLQECKETVQAKQLDRERVAREEKAQRDLNQAKYLLTQIKGFALAAIARGETRLCLSGKFPHDYPYYQMEYSGHFDDFTSPDPDKLDGIARILFDECRKAGLEPYLEVERKQQEGQSPSTELALYIKL